MSVRIINADCRDALRDLPGASIDAVVTDPPYGLVFMGKQWDTGEVAFDPAFWAEVLRVMKPGAHLVTFGGARTFHRLVCAIEDAGFEVRDQLAWLFGSGFPKSHDVSKAIDKAAGAEREKIAVSGDAPAYQRSIGNSRPWMENPNHLRDGPDAVTDAARQWQGWGTALKPAHEPICLARKPLIGTVAANVLAHGTGALNIDASRIGVREKPRITDPKGAGHAHNTYGAPSGGGNVLPDGRWPANVLHDGSPDVLDVFPRDAGAFAPVRGTEPSRPAKNTYGEFERGGGAFHGDSGSAARFFYTAKADADDRLGSKHPTVKPVDLMAYLVRLVTPPGGTVLDPFAGSGTTGMACMREGFQSILIEREAEYVADIKRRIAHVRGEDAPLFAQASP